MSQNSKLEILKRLNVEMSIAIDLYKKGQLNDEDFIKISLEIDDEKNKLLMEEDKNDVKKFILKFIK